jgi:hypothetical protein
MAGFPASVDALTSDWLSAVLQRPVRGFEVERFGEGAGLIGMVTRLHLDAEPEDGPATVIAKFPSPSAANRTVAETYDMYGREVNFYRTIAPRVELRTPACYYGAFDRKTQDFVLLLEDLKDFRVGDQVAGCTLEEARAILATLARFHASAWQRQDLTDVVLHNNPMQRDGMVAGFGVGWPACLERFPALIPPSARDIGARYPANVPRLLEEMCAAPVCLIHGDLRIDNVFYGEDAIALVDWQAVCRSAPEQDVAYFVTQSVPKAVRSQDDLLGHYQRALQDELANRGIAYDLATSTRRYEVSALYLLSFAVVIAGTLDMANERGLKLATDILDGSLSALDELDAFRLLG